MSEIDDIKEVKKKAIIVIKDVRFLGHCNAIEYQFIKKYVDDNGDLKKENSRGVIMLDGVEGSDATEQLSKLVPFIVLEQAKTIGELNERINAMSKECAQKVDIATKESSEKMIVKTENQSLKEAVKAHEENFNMAKSINDEIYAENKKLKETIERNLKDMVKLDENIVNLNAQIVALKETKKGK